MQQPDYPQEIEQMTTPLVDLDFRMSDGFTFTTSVSVHRMNNLGDTAIEIFNKDVNNFDVTEMAVAVLLPEQVRELIARLELAITRHDQETDQ